MKLDDLRKINKLMTLPNKSQVDYSVALCDACISSIDLRYRRKNLLTEDDKQYIAERMSAKFKYWSVCDLKCFEDMLIGARLPSVRCGQTEYELTMINIPNLLSKAEVYDKMRPSSESLQGNSPQKEVPVRPLTAWHRNHLLDGSAYDWSVPYEDWKRGRTQARGDPDANSERYWREVVDQKNDEYDRAAVEAIVERVKRRMNITILNNGNKN